MRLFFGLSLPDEIRCASAAYSESVRSVVPGRYSPADNHHITLAFLGEIAPERLRDAHAVLADTLSHYPAPTITLQSISHFGRINNAILVILADSVPSLAPLHDALIHSLRANNLPCDSGPFTPHITLARHADLTDAALPRVAPCSFSPTHAHVFLSSRSEENVLVYTPLLSAPFLP